MCYRQLFCIGCGEINETTERWPDWALPCFSCTHIICAPCATLFYPEEWPTQDEILSLSQHDRLGSFMCRYCRGLFQKREEQKSEQDSETIPNNLCWNVC